MVAFVVLPILAASFVAGLLVWLNVGDQFSDVDIRYIVEDCIVADSPPEASFLQWTPDDDRLLQRHIEDTAKP